jgi:divalent metal cation (Fe/Co/Zn/Cd) transporter
LSARLHFQFVCEIVCLATASVSSFIDAPSLASGYWNLQVWDGVGSILVGVLLAGVAVYLIQRNRSFLIGRSMAVDDFQKIVHHLRRDPVVKNVYEAKSEEIGEGIFRHVSLKSVCTLVCSLEHRMNLLNTLV